MVTKQFFELFDKKFSPLCVNLPHPFDMTQEKTVIDKSRQRCLVDGRGVLIHRTTDFDQCINQRLWRNDVAQSQRGTKNLADRPCVNHSTSFVDPLQRRQWWSYEAELSVVIILENKRVVSARKIEQAGPSLESHGNAERELVRGRHVNYLRKWFFPRSSDHNSLIVERLGN